MTAPSVYWKEVERNYLRITAGEDESSTRSNL